MMAQACNPVPVTNTSDPPSKIQQVAMHSSPRRISESCHSPIKSKGNSMPSLSSSSPRRQMSTSSKSLGSPAKSPQKSAHSPSLSPRRKSNRREMDRKLQQAIVEQVGEGPVLRFGPVCQPTALPQQISKLSIDKLDAYIKIKATLEAEQADEAKKDRLSGEILLRVAMFCNFSLEPSMKLLRRTDSSCLRLSANRIANDLKRNIVVPLPFLQTKEGHDMIYFCPERIQPKDDSASMLKSMLIYAMNSIYERHRNPRRKMAMLINLSNWTMKEHFALDHWLQIIDIFQGHVAPMRISQVFLVKPPEDFDRAFKMIKFMCKAGYDHRFHRLKCEEALSQFFSLGYETYLPNDFECGMVPVEHLVRDFVSYRQALERLAKQSSYKSSPRHKQKSSAQSINSVEATPKIQNKRPTFQRHSSMPGLLKATADAPLTPTESTTEDSDTSRPFDCPPPLARESTQSETNLPCTPKRENAAKSSIASPSKGPASSKDAGISKTSCPPPVLPVKSPSNKPPNTPKTEHPPPPPHSESPSKIRASPQRILKRIASVPMLLVSSLMSSPSKSSKMIDSESEHEDVEPKDLSETSEESEALSKETPTTPKTPRDSSSCVRPKLEREASQATLARSITPFRRRSCMGSTPSTPSKTIRRRASSRVRAISVSDLSLEKKKEEPSQSRTTRATLRPTLARSTSAFDNMSVSSRNLMRRNMAINDPEPPSEETEPLRVSDPTSAVAAMASTALPRKRSTSRRDLMRRSMSSGSLRL